MHCDHGFHHLFMGCARECPSGPQRGNLQTHTHGGTHKHTPPYTSDVRAIGKNLGKLLQEAPFHSLSVLNLSSHPLLEREGERERERARKWEQRIEKGGVKERRAEGYRLTPLIWIHAPRNGEMERTGTCCSLPYRVTPASRNKIHFGLCFAPGYSCNISVKVNLF